MITWLKRSRQTRTPVHDQSAQREECRSGLRLAYQTLAAGQLISQLLLWLVLYGYEPLKHTLWQAALMLCLPALLLWLTWRLPTKTGPRSPRAGFGLLLLPCLILDGYLLMLASCSLMSYMIPAFPLWIQLATVSLFPLLTLWVSGKNGVAYGAYTLRFLLLALFILITLSTVGSATPKALWPLLGDGLPKTALAALGGAGACWGIGLVYLLPQEASAPNAPAKGRQRPGGGLFVWLPMVLCLLWALWMSLLCPWRPGEALSVGQRMAASSRHSSLILLGEAGALFWMLLLPVSQLGTLHAGARLLQAVMPKAPQRLWPFVLLLPSIAGVYFSPSEALPFIAPLLPWRFALSALCGLCLWFAAKKEGGI